MLYYCDYRVNELTEEEARTVSSLYNLALNGRPNFAEEAGRAIDIFPLFDFTGIREDVDGFNLLCAAVSGGHPANVRECLRRGYDVAEVMKDGKHLGMRAVHIAATQDSVEVLTLLAEHGADFNAGVVCGVNEGRTPLMIACANWFSCGRTLPALVAAGADVNALDATGRTALLFAVEADANPEVFDLLLASGADVDLGHWDGEGARSFASGLLCEKEVGPFAYCGSLAAACGLVPSA